MLKYRDRVSFFIASTIAEKNHLIRYGIDASKILVLPLGVKLLKLDFAHKKNKNITYIGRLSKTKNIELLIEAFANLQNTDTHLTISGPDYGQLQFLQNMVKKLNIENRVTFTGWLNNNEKLNLLSQTTIFVHPSLEDVFSLSLAEASASGVPVVAFDVEANSEIIQDMVTGKLAKKTNSESLREAIDYILNNPELISKFSQNGRDLIPRKYDWSQSALILENLYSSLISN